MIKLKFIRITLDLCEVLMISWTNLTLNQLSVLETIVMVFGPYRRN